MDNIISVYETFAVCETFQSSFFEPNENKSILVI